MSDINELLNGAPKEKFQSTMNKLLNVCFILKRDNDTASDYNFIRTNEQTFRDVLSLLGYELIINEEQGVIAVSNPNGTGRIRMTKSESTMLLILRLLYIEKSKELSQTQNIIVTISDIYDKFDMIHIAKPKKDALVSALRMFKHYNIIHNLDTMDGGNIECRIQIYPSVMLAITNTSLEEIYKKAQERLEEYGGDCNGNEDAGTGNNEENAD